MTFMKGHEIMSICVLPIAYGASTVQLRKLLRQLVAYGIRQDSNFSFNPLKIQGAIRTLITAMFSAESTVDITLRKLVDTLKGWLPAVETVKRRLATDLYMRSWFNKARCALLYLAEATDSHEAVLNHDIVHIDHIYPQKSRKSDPALAEKDNKHRLGNLTPLCGPNSAAGLKGNSSLSNKPFAEKLTSYAASNIAMTRTVATTYATSGFLDAQIEERSWTLATQLDELTAADLAL